MKENNIILFPKLKTTLTERGMTALENQNYREALEYFDQLLDMEPKHPQANLGKAICFIQQHRFQDAADICEFMLDEQMTNMQEVIQVYVSVLIQLEQYKKAADLLEEALRAETLPNIVINYYQQMLHFCRQMIKEKNDTISQDEIKRLSTLLYSDSLEKQMLAVKKLTNQPNDTMLEQLNRYLKDEKSDPVLKTIIVQHLTKEKVNATLEIQKFSKHMIINPTQIILPEKDPFILNVKKLLSDVIESKNPTLYELSIQVLSNLLMVLYPFPLPAYTPETIAAAIHIESEKSNGFPISIGTIASMYHVEQKELEACLIELEKIMDYNQNQ